jgi:acylphosphatase
MAETARHIVFTGRVQGVGFRFVVFRAANRYQLAGWVRNCDDGSVEMVVQGLADGIDDCVLDIQQSFAGYIRETKIEPVPPDPKHKDFKITF